MTVFQEDFFLFFISRKINERSAKTRRFFLGDVPAASSTGSTASDNF